MDLLKAVKILSKRKSIPEFEFTRRTGTTFRHMETMQRFGMVYSLSAIDRMARAFNITSSALLLIAENANELETGFDEKLINVALQNVRKL